jgi:hypothetical protein
MGVTDALQCVTCLHVNAFRSDAILSIVDEGTTNRDFSLQTEGVTRSHNII